MDGIDNPPFFRKLYTNRINTFLDAHLHRPEADRQAIAPPAPAAPASEQIYFIGATNVPSTSSTPR